MKTIQELDELLHAQHLGDKTLTYCTATFKQYRDFTKSGLVVEFMSLRKFELFCLDCLLFAFSDKKHNFNKIVKMKIVINDIEIPISPNMIKSIILSTNKWYLQDSDILEAKAYKGFNFIQEISRYFLL